MRFGSTVAILLCACGGSGVVAQGQADSAPDLGGGDMVVIPMNATSGSGGALGDYEEHLMSGGASRLIAVHVPPTYTGASGVPLIVHFHGWRPLPAGVTAEIKFIWASVADQNGFIAVAPEGLPCPELDPGGPPYGCFEATTDRPFVEQLISDLGAKYNIDLDRVYLSGHSGGSFFDQELAIADSDRYAAAVEISGGCISDSNAYGNSCSVYDTLSQKAARKIPMFLMHNVDDQVVPNEYSMDLFGLLSDDGHPVSGILDQSYDGGDTGHSVDPTLIPQVWSWISNYRLSH